MTRDDLATLYSALDSAHSAMAMSSNDWSTNADFAWLYGIVVGWDNDPTDHEDDQFDTMGHLARRFGWTTGDVERLRTLRAAVAAFDISAVAELGVGR